MIVAKGALEIWTGAEGSTHFLRVTGERSDEIRAQSLAVRRGFGSVRVEATMNDVTWRTSLFPSKGGGYFLPVKVAVLRKTGIAAGDEVTIRLEFL